MRNLLAVCTLALLTHACSNDVAFEDKRHDGEKKEPVVATDEAAALSSYGSNLPNSRNLVTSPLDQYPTIYGLIEGTGAVRVTKYTPEQGWLSHMLGPATFRGGLVTLPKEKDSTQAIYGVDKDTGRLRIFKFDPDQKAWVTFLLGTMTFEGDLTYSVLDDTPTFYGINDQTKLLGVTKYDRDQRAWISFDLGTIQFESGLMTLPSDQTQTIYGLQRGTGLVAVTKFEPAQMKWISFVLGSVPFKGNLVYSDKDTSPTIYGTDRTSGVLGVTKFDPAQMKWISFLLGTRRFEGGTLITTKFDTTPTVYGIDETGQLGVTKFDAAQMRWVSFVLGTMRFRGGLVTSPKDDVQALYGVNNETGRLGVIRWFPRELRWQNFDLVNETYTAGCGTLPAGQWLEKGQTLAACYGPYRLRLEQDGNLVVYRVANDKEEPVWSTVAGRIGYPRPLGYGATGTRAVMQTDGNFNLYNGSTGTWNSATWGNPNARLVMQDDGNLVVYSSDTRVLWSSAKSAECGVLLPGQSLGRGESIRSCNNQYKLEMRQDTGNLVLSCDSCSFKPMIWSTESGYNPYYTSPSSPSYGATFYGPQRAGPGKGFGTSAAMQGDGNFVLYKGAEAQWSTSTNGFSGAKLVLQNDGNLVIQGSKPVWSVRTGRVQ